jgi:hypothetical protein
MATLNDWRIAYAKQGQADLLAREQLLENPALPECQHLHFLQMACEKICKAYLCGQGSDFAGLRRSHGYISGPLPTIARQVFARTPNADRSWVLSAIRNLARRIELLAPAVDQAGTYPANCEYPWERSDSSVAVPAEHNFGIDLAREPAGRHLLKVLQVAAEELIR